MTTFNNLASFGSQFQVKVIAALLSHKEFLVNINDTIIPDYFDDKALQWVVEQTLKYYDKYHTTPDMTVLSVELKKLDNEILKIAIKEKLKEAYSISENDLPYIEEEFSNFCKNQQLKNALLTSVDLLQSGQYDDIRHIIDNALKAGQDKNLGHEYLKDIEERYRSDGRAPISTPWVEINKLTAGGLGGGDFGLVFGNPGGGKSWCLTSLGAEAVKNGYNVIHYTLELGADYVGKRYDAYFSNISVTEIENNKAAVESAISALEGKLIIKEYAPKRASVSTIESHIKKCMDFGFKPDLIIIDYVDLLSSKNRMNRERKDEIDDIYIGTKGLAKAYKLPIWSVSQVNRAGAKDDVIEGDKSSGSYDKIMIADIAISLSRKKEDKVAGTGRIHIMKNRYGKDGLTYNVELNTEKGYMKILEEYDSEAVTPQQIKDNSNLSPSEKKLLSKKFFELGN